MCQKALLFTMIFAIQSFASPPTLHSMEAATAVLDWLEPESVIDTPMVVHTGFPRAWEGSGMGTGNLLFEIPFSTTLLSIFYNSVAAVRQLGWGRGFSLSIDRMIYLTGNSSGFLVTGDGTNIALTVVSNKWRPTRLNQLNSQFVRNATS